MLVLSMGFAANRVDWALHSTSNSGLQSALDHLEAHQDETVPDYKNQPAKTAGGDYDDDEQAALADMLKSKGQQAVDDAVKAGAEAKVSLCYRLDWEIATMYINLTSYALSSHLSSQSSVPNAIESLGTRTLLLSMPRRVDILALKRVQKR